MQGEEGPAQMRICLVQQRVIEGGKELNVARGLEAVETAAEGGAELICFAELAFEKFYPQHPAAGDVLQLAEQIPGPTTDLFCKKAKELGVVIVLNLYERGTGNSQQENAYDCSPVIDVDGTLLGRTRMVHITDYACFHERGYYTPGDGGAEVFETKVGRVGVAICYDRHFPEYMRALALHGAELVLIPQAGVVDEWPDGLYEAEVRVAAFQNGYFAALCNRVGEEEKLTFSGESFVCDPTGLVNARGPRCEEGLVFADLDFEKLKTSSAKQLFLSDRRPELYKDWLNTE